MIKIGADELILWMRKNRYGDRFNTRELGRRICRIIERNGGEKAMGGRNRPCIWVRPADVSEACRNIQIVVTEKINPRLLPRTAQQYCIDPENIGDVFRELSRMGR
jgi:hypothetical protein